MVAPCVFHRDYVAKSRLAPVLALNVLTDGTSHLGAHRALVPARELDEPFVQVGLDPRVEVVALRFLSDQLGHLGGTLHERADGVKRLWTSCGYPL